MGKRRYFYFTCPFCGEPKILDNKTGAWRHDWVKHARIMAQAH